MNKYNKLLSVAVATAMGLSVNVSAQDSEDEELELTEEVVVTGIRSSLKKSMEIKRDSIGVVDAISAEDMGKFPDTNLAESLQRITGVSIDRQLGEGATVTARGWGADFNLVTFNNRQMPTTSLGDGASAPSGRSYNFANVASEAIAGVEVYKTSNANIATGGIGATINIKTPRPLDSPGLKWTAGIKGVMDESQNSSTDITPEVSGIFTNTFADDTFGVAISGSYQQRKSGFNQANVGWRDGYLGSCDYANEWGALPSADCNSWNNIDGVTNRPGDNDVYEIPQNASYDLGNVDRERVNGQLVLQYAPTDRWTGTLDYTYSQNEIEVRSSGVGIWFNHGFTNSAWTDGPVAGPLFYTEFLGGSDLSYSGSLTANQSEDKSLGFNLEFFATDRLTLELDYHDSSAEVKPNNIYGSNMSVGTTVFGIDTQTINFEQDLPVISFTNVAGIDSEDPAARLASGSAFRNAQQRSDVEQIQLNGTFDVDPSIFASGKFVDSIDFGFSRVNNNVKSQFGVLQTDSWGGLGTPDTLPDDVFTFETLPDKFSDFSGSDNPDMIQGFYSFDFERVVDILEQEFGICSNSWVGTNIEGTCLANFDTDRDLEETISSAYVQFNNEFEISGRPAHLNAGFRYEETDVTGTAVVPIPVGTFWGAVNEFNLEFGPDNEATSITGDYSNFLPSLNFDMQPIENVIMRASWSKTISRQTYDKLQGGRSVASLFRVDGGNGSQGNPDLEPLESKNFDFSLEWYYDDTGSYVSAGYFNKKVKNFSTLGRITESLFGLTHPLYGPRGDQARAALDGEFSDLSEVRQYLLDPANGFDGVETTGVDGSGLFTGRIIGLPEDEPLQFDITLPVVDPEVEEVDGIELALQHNFGESGFGMILNYTIVDGEVTYDNTQPYQTEQFVLPGLSDTYNIVAYYDKNGLQGRLAYNWRDEFLGGGLINPFYTEEYGQLDANISYELLDGWTIYAEAINLTGESRRGHRRSDNNVFFANQGEPRYMFGARYKY